MKNVVFGRTEIEISSVSYGGIVSAGYYDRVHYPQWDQAASDGYVRWALEQGVNYFDVAPSYGNAQEQLGNSLKGNRDQITLACKTALRDREGAERELEESLRQLHTDHFDVYQLHAIASMEDVDRAFGPGGAMEVFRDLKSRGITRFVGFTAHSQKAALKMLELYDFDTVLFPLNWGMHGVHQMGAQLLEKARERNMGILAMKAFIERAWQNDNERASSRFPKSWCKPIDPEDEDFVLAAMRYTLSLGVHTLIPPGNFDLRSVSSDRHWNLRSLKRTARCLPPSGKDIPERNSSLSSSNPLLVSTVPLLAKIPLKSVFRGIWFFWGSEETSGQIPLRR